MSITVFVKTKAGVHDVEVAGTETVGSLYKKAGCAAGLLEGRFKLVWEESVLSRFKDEDVQGIGLVEGAVVHLVPGTIVGLEELKEGPAGVKLDLERLVTTDPELVLEVDVGDSPDMVVCLGKQDLPFGLRSLLVTDSTNRARDIGDGFLYSCCLTSLNLNLKLTTIGSRFLYLSFLSVINFSSPDIFPNITSIGVNFLSGCSGLQNVDLSIFANVAYIGDHFLSGCSGLQSVDLTVFTNIAFVGDYFLSGCSGMRSVEAPTLPQEHPLMVAMQEVETIGA